MMFKDALLNAMVELNLNQRQVVGMTGCSKASISQYLSGKNVPSVQKQRDIAESLGLDPEYFQWAEPQKTAAQSVRRGQIRRLLPEAAAKILGVNKQTVRNGLQQGVFPWGYGIHMDSGRWVYIINADRFAEIEGVQV